MWGKFNSLYGVCAIQWNEHHAIEKLYFSASVEFATTRDDRMAAELGHRIFGGDAIEVSLSGSELEMAVWQQLRQIPRGATHTYTQIATAIGRERAVRAVASAIGRNEVSYLVPCHRVIRADGSLGGYRWGLDIKKKILFDEQLTKKTDI